LFKKKVLFEDGQGQGFGEDDIENELKKSFGSSEKKNVKAPKQVFYKIQNMIH
jgi:hypothetical protein